MISAMATSWLVDDLCDRPTNSNGLTNREQADFRPSTPAKGRETASVIARAESANESTFAPVFSSTISEDKAKVNNPIR
jgi:hypothetical protein